MVEFKPNYYSKFKCIGGRCKHSCCIGWEIDIDEGAYKKYKAQKGEFGKKFKSCISLEDTPHFILGEGERCPFLNADNLCDIITGLGEDKLCQICRDHPRFRNFYEDFTEVGLGLCCEEACRIILSEKEPFYLIGEQKDSDFLSFRGEIFEILQDRGLPIEKRISKLLHRFDLKEGERSLADWAEIFENFEILDSDWLSKLSYLKTCEFKPIKNDLIFENLLVYFIFRHLADSYINMTEHLCILFSILGARVINALSEKFDVFEVARLFSSEIEYCEENLEEIFNLLDR